MFSLPYDTSCDMFSVGVILAEFYLGKPPFWGETNTDQVASMMEVLGLVPPHMIEVSPWQHVYRRNSVFFFLNKKTIFNFILL